METSYFTCGTCGTRHKLVIEIQRGFADFGEYSCIACGDYIASVRNDVEVSYEISELGDKIIRAS